MWTWAGRGLEWGLGGKNIFCLFFFWSSFTKFPSCSDLEIDSSTWECVLCIFHSSLPRKNVQFSKKSKTETYLARGAWVPPAVRNRVPPRSAQEDPRQDTIGTSAFLGAARRWLLRGECFKPAGTKYHFEKKHLRLWVAWVKDTLLWFFSHVAVPHTSKHISEGSASSVL